MKKTIRQITIFFTVFIDEKLYFLYFTSHFFVYASMSY